MVKSKIYYGEAIGGLTTKWFPSIDSALLYFKTNGIMVQYIEHREDIISLMWFKNNDFEGYPVNIYKINQ